MASMTTDRPLPLLGQSSPGHSEDRPHPPDTLLPADPAAGTVPWGEPLPAREVLDALAAGNPASPAAWAALAESALSADHPVEAYAYARTGYHRGLDQLRRAGWRGAGPVPWEHEPNRGWLRAVAALATAADRVDEPAEAARCRELLLDSSVTAVTALLPDPSGQA